MRLTLSLLVVCALHQAVSANEVEIHFLDVDQGSATLIRVPSGATVLIDGGFDGFGSGRVIPYLQGLGLSTLTYSIATHWHSDHIGGMDEVFAAGYLPELAAYDRGNFNIPSNSFVSDYLAAVGNKRAQPTVGLQLALGSGVSLEFVAENGRYPGGAVDPWQGSQGENAASIAAVFRYGDFELWLGGDLTGGGSGTVDMESLVAPFVGQVEVVLANHHGSPTSSNANFVQWLDPSFVVHSCGLNNPYSHPDQGVLDRWNSVSAARIQWSTTAGDTSVLRRGFTVADQSIQVTSDGMTFTVQRSQGTERLMFATYELALPAVQSADLVCSELLIDPDATSDSNGEWFELATLSAGVRSLQDVRITSGADSFTLASKLLSVPGERHTVCVDGWQSRNGNVPPTIVTPANTFALTNSPSSLVLRDALDQVLETIVWGGGGIAFLPGIAIERIALNSAPDQSNFANAITSWSGGDLGTPSERNDNELSLCGKVVRYCIANQNSSGFPTPIDSRGSLDVEENQFTLLAENAPPGQFGVFYYGTNPVQLAFGNGYRCIGAGPIFRFPPIAVPSSGSAEFAVDFTNLPPGGRITNGSTWYFQFWYRDPMGGGAAFNLSDGIEVSFCSQAPAPIAGEVIVSEFMADPLLVSDEQGEWLELLNLTTRTIDLNGWILRSGQGEFHLIDSPQLMLAPNAQLVLGRSANTSSNGGITVNYAYGSALNFAQAEDIIRLESPAGVLIDQVAYDSFFFPIESGRSCSLDPIHQDHQANDDGSRWCASSTWIGSGPDRGTPGTANEDCP